MFARKTRFGHQRDEIKPGNRIGRKIKKKYIVKKKKEKIKSRASKLVKLCLKCHHSEVDWVAKDSHGTFLEGLGKRWMSMADSVDVLA